jgi:hypothetical protein
MGGIVRGYGTSDHVHIGVGDTRSEIAGRYLCFVTHWTALMTLAGLEEVANRNDLRKPHQPPSASQDALLCRDWQIAGAGFR